MPKKRVLSFVLIALLGAACRKPASPAQTATAAAPQTAAGQPAATKPVPGKLPDVVATVNGEKVERWELQSAVHGVETAHAGTPMPPERRDELLRGLLDQIVTFHVLAQEAYARKLDASDADVTARLTQTRSGYPNEEAFQQALAGRGLTLEQFQRQTRQSMAVANLIDAEIMSKISVQDTDVEAFYQQNTERFKLGETVHASHILVGVAEGTDAAQKLRAHAKAQQLLKQLRGGTDFAKLAREQSQDPSSAPSGGDLGFFPKDQIDPTFATAAFALKLGATSDVVETPFGFHIIKLHERRPPRTEALTEVGGQIKEFLTDQQRGTMLNALVEQMRTKTKIEILI